MVKPPHEYVDNSYDPHEARWIIGFIVSFGIILIAIMGWLLSGVPPEVYKYGALVIGSAILFFGLPWGLGCVVEEVSRRWSER